MDKSSLLACWSRPSACSAEQCLMSRSSNPHLVCSAKQWMILSFASASGIMFSKAVLDIELFRPLK